MWSPETQANILNLHGIHLPLIPKPVMGDRHIGFHTHSQFLRRKSRRSDCKSSPPPQSQSGEIIPRERSYRGESVGHTRAYGFGLGWGSVAIQYYWYVYQYMRRWQTAPEVLSVVQSGVHIVSVVYDVVKLRRETSVLCELYLSPAIVWSGWLHLAGDSRNTRCTACLTVGAGELQRQSPPELWTVETQW
jgi:hypothetical protein